MSLDDGAIRLAVAPLPRPCGDGSAGVGQEQRDGRIDRRPRAPIRAVTRLPAEPPDNPADLGLPGLLPEPTIYLDQQRAKVIAREPAVPEMASDRDERVMCVAFP